MCTTLSSDCMPHDLWAKVFCQMLVIDEDLASWYNVAKDQKEVLSVRQVCRMFRDVFDSCPQLSRQLTVPVCFTPDGLSSLLSWMKKQGTSIKVFKDITDTGCQGLILEDLLCAQPMLHSIGLFACQAVHIHWISQFRHLRTCKVSGNGEAVLDISPLQQMASLSSLQLYDQAFSSIELPPHLTLLDLLAASIDTTTDVDEDVSPLCSSSTLKKRAL